MTTPTLPVAESKNIHPEAANPRRLKVLLCAHDCSPSKGSECAVGWNLATALARYHDVTVLCAAGSQAAPNSHREAIAAYIGAHGPVPNLAVSFVEQPPFGQWLTRWNLLFSGMSDGVGVRPLFKAALHSWQRQANCVAHEQGLEHFDVIHHVTPVAYWGFSEITDTDKPHFWGPMSGLETTPLSFARWLGGKCLAFELARNTFTWCQVNLLSRLRRNLLRSAVVWTVTKSDAGIVRRISGTAPRTMTDAACPSNVVGHRRDYDSRRPLLLCWSGHHSARKALPILLHALALLDRRDLVSLVVLGGGAETLRWQRLANSLGLENTVRWTGKVVRDSAIEIMRKADVLVHTSIREATGVVIFEALALGMPVICHDACGMAVVVNETCGIKVPFLSPDESVRGFREAIEKLLLKPELVSELSAGALCRATELTWDVKARQIADTYIRVQDELAASQRAAGERSDC